MYVFEQCPSGWQWRLLVPVLCIYPLIGMSDARCLPSPPRIPPLRRRVVFVVRSVPDRVPLIVSDISLAYPCVSAGPYQASVLAACAHCALCGLSKP